MSSPLANSVASAGARWNLPATLVLGLAIIFICEALLLADVRISGRGPMHTEPAMEAFDRDHPPSGVFQAIARCVSVNITPLAWLGYIVFIEGLLTLQTGTSPIRRRPHHFALLCLASVFIWCVFDWVNFYSIRAWRYVGMPESFDQRALGYLLAFGAIVPGMLMSGQALMNMRAFDWARAPSWRLPRWAPWLSLIAGVAMFLWPWFHPDPITNLTLWASLVFLLDPINYWLGRPSMWRDWERGWFGRTLACFAGGLVCGLLWEFWNYWALTKWIYRLPFLGGAEHIRYFEMPVLGLIGFLPFGLECWVMWQTIRIALDGLAEGLPDDRSLL
jgi:hypothetical protein